MEPRGAHQTRLIMPTFQYTYISSTGELRQGTLQADDVDYALLRLREQGIVPLDFKEIALKKQRMLNARHLSVFFKQMYSLIRVGDVLRLDEALAMLEEQLPPWARTPYREAVLAVAQGTSLPSALARTRLFPDLVIATLQVADTTGKNEEAAQRLGVYYERISGFNARLRGALTYPAILLAFAVLITWGLMTFVVPQFVGILRDANISLPLPTQMVIALSGLVSSPAFLAGVGLLALLIEPLRRQYMKRRENRLNVERALLRIPVVRELLKYNALADLAATLRLGYSAGIPLHEALGLTKGVLGLELYRNLIDITRERVLQGFTLHAALSTNTPKEMLPNVFSSLIRVGESSGSLEETLGHAERIYVEEIESILDSLGAVIEPALLVVVGALVGGILLSVLLPYFSLVQNIGGLSGP